MNKLRALILKGEFSAKDLILSKGEVAVVKKAKIRPINSKELAVTNGISSQQACNMLAKLEKKGYLEHRVIQTPGNNPYKAYSVPRGLRKYL